MDYNGAAVVERVKKAIHKKGLSVKEALLKMELNATTLTNWKQGVIPSVKKAIEVSKFVGVSVQELFIGEVEDEKGELRPDEIKLIELYNKLPDRAQPLLMEHLRVVLENEKLVKQEINEILEDKDEEIAALTASKSQKVSIIPVGRKGILKK